MQKKERCIDTHVRVETTNYELLRAKFSENHLSGETQVGKTLPS